MNSLSWFLYFIDMIGNVKGLTLMLAIGAAVMWGMLNLAVPITEGDIITEWADYRKWWVRGALIMVSCGVVFCLLPSKNTMYAIAASQVGEQVIKNEAVQGIANDATKALHQWIKRQIEPEPKAAK